MGGEVEGEGGLDTPKASQGGGGGEGGLDTPKASQGGGGGEGGLDTPKASQHTIFDTTKLITFFLCSLRDSNSGHAWQWHGPCLFLVRGSTN